MTRAVLDTNVLVSAAIGSQGAPADCLRAHAEGLFDLIVSPALLRELRTVLARPRFLPYLDREQAERFVATLEQGALVTDDPPDPPPLSRDPDDDNLLGLARASEAVVLITGDRHLLAVEAADIRVVRPRTFLELLSGRP